MVPTLAPPVAAWFAEAFPSPTDAQRRALPHLLAREDLLLSSPTGSGKTLAAFLAVLSDLHEEAAAGTLSDGIRCVYVSPLKALVEDIARNLEMPLAALEARTGAGIRVAVRTGDTSQAERRALVRHPPHILVTTPESAALLLLSASVRKALAPLRWILVDEVHALAGTKRGTHLALTLERLERHAVARPVRVGLSATVAPLDEVARFVAGGRPCAIEVAAPKAPPLIDVVPTQGEDDLVRQLEEIVHAHRTTLVFASTRHATERLAARLATRLGGAVEEGLEDAEDAEGDPVEAPPVATHHGSMSKERRAEVERRLKARDVRCVVTSSSLELGVHFDGIGHVALVGSPKSVARALQRVGRADHRVGGQSRATLFVQDVDDLPEAWAVVEEARAGRIEPLAPAPGTVDVLAQHLVGLAVEGGHDRDTAFALVRRAWPFRELAREAFDEALSLVGDYVDEVDGELVAAGPRARMVLGLQGGTIPEVVHVKVYHERRYIGEIEEAFLEALSEGDTFRLAGETWRYLGATGLHARVAPARGRHAALPEWRAEGLGVTPELAEAMRPYRARRQQPNHVSSVTQSAWDVHWDRQAALQPLPEGLAVESAPTDDGERALVFHHVAPRRVNDALARTLAERLGGGRALACDTGFALLVPRAMRPTRAQLARLFDAPLPPTLEAALERSDLLKRRFRHVAFRALALRKDRIPPVQRQRTANQLLARLRHEEPDHPLLREARREALADALDVDGAERVRAAVASGELPLVLLPARSVLSPMGARILVRLPEPDRRTALADHDAGAEMAARTVHGLAARADGGRVQER